MTGLLTINPVMLWIIPRVSNTKPPWCYFVENKLRTLATLSLVTAIARCLHNPSMDPAIRERVEKKFDIGYLMAKENLPFTKYPAIHDLLERHGVELVTRPDSQLTILHISLQTIFSTNAVQYSF